MTKIPSYGLGNELALGLSSPKLIQINVPGSVGDFSLLPSNNANTGGTCFGDSGGPNFIGDSNAVSGVTAQNVVKGCGLVDPLRHSSTALDVFDYG